MAGPSRWFGWAAAAAMTFAALTPKNVQAQYLFRYAVWGQHTPAPGDGYPFADMLCEGTSPTIFWDSDPLTTTPKFNDLCPAIGPEQDNFGMQVAAIVHAFVDAPFTFYVGSDDGSSLWIDGVRVMFLEGERPFHGATVTVPFLAGTNHSYLINYYDNDFGGNAIAAVVDNHLAVSAPPPDFFDPGPHDPHDPFAPPPDVTPSPEPSTVVMLATAFGILALVAVRRNKVRQAA